MARMASLFQLAQSGEKDCSLQVLESLGVDGGVEEQVRGTILRAVRLVRQGSGEAALAVLTHARTRMGFMPTAIIACIIDLCIAMGKEQRAAHECVAFARDTIALGYRDLAMEACTAALILDGRSTFEIIRSSSSLREIAGWYEDTALALVAPSCRLAVAGIPARTKVGLMVPNLVDDIVGNIKTLLHLVRYLDRNRCDIAVYVTENLSRRESPLFPYGCCDGISEERGAATIRTIRGLKVPIHMAKRSGTLSQSALGLVAQIEADSPDILIVQSGLACPIDWLAMRLVNVPVKMSIHNGTSLYMPGMNINVFDNPVNIEREDASWDTSFGQRVVLAQGTDIEELRGRAALSRAAFDIPSDAIVVGTLSNHLGRRLSKDYLSVIADILSAEKHTWFIGFGGGDMAAAKAFFASRGVFDRVRFGGRQASAGSALKILDVYANEFPVGGSQSVIEAMACGIPVVALRWSDAHAESAGANAVGPGLAIPGPDIDAYRNLLSHFVCNAAARAKAAAMVTRRVEANFSVRTYARMLLDMGLEALDRQSHMPDCEAGTMKEAV
ncbi:MAG: glycosyltransferase [bacterium]